jgi:hypothetical protein
VIAGVDHGRDGEPAASGLSCEGDASRRCAVLQESFIGRQSVVNRRRIRMLGTEPVVDGDDLGAGPAADLRGQVGGEKGITKYVYAAVKVQDDVPGFDSVDGDLGRGDGAQRGCGHGHAGGQWLRR